MPKTKLDCVNMALRRLGVLSAETVPSADQFAFCGDVLDGLFAEINETQGFGWTWTTETVPDTHFLALSYLLAVDVAAHFEIPPRESRAAMVARLRALSFPNDLPIRADLDDDATVSSTEADIDLEAQYY
jgi:hypothetical protein